MVDQVEMKDSPIKILLIEDNPGDVVLFKHACENAFENIKVVNVSSVNKAVSVLKTDSDFDLIFTDLNTPDSIGASSVKDLRQVLPDARIIVLTGISTPLTVDECRKAGAMGFLLKGELNSNKIAETLQSIGFGVKTT